MISRVRVWTANAETNSHNAVPGLTKGCRDLETFEPLAQEMVLASQASRNQHSKHTYPHPTIQLGPAAPNKHQTGFPFQLQGALQDREMRFATSSVLALVVAYFFVIKKHRTASSTTDRLKRQREQMQPRSTGLNSDPLKLEL